MRILLVAFLVLLSLQPVFPDAQRYPPGLVVEDVEPGSPAEKAGLKQSDVILTLDGEPLCFGGSVAVSLQHARVAGKGSILLVLRRGPESHTLTLDVAPFLGLTCRPPLPSEAGNLYAEAQGVPEGSRGVAETKLTTAAAAADRYGDARASAFLWWKVYLVAAQGSPQEKQSLQRASNMARVCGDAWGEAVLYCELADMAHRGRALDLAEKYTRQALGIQEKITPGSPAVAQTIGDLAVILKDRGNLAGAEADCRRALAIYEKVDSPDHLGVAATLENLGLVLKDRGKLAGAAAAYRRAMTIYEKADPPLPLPVAACLNKLGTLLCGLGDPAQAADYHGRALAIYEKADPPKPLSVADCLNNLGRDLWDRGSAAGAEVHHRRALAVYEKADPPEPLSVAMCLNNLGDDLKDQGNLPGAEAFYRRALVMYRKADPPEPLSVAMCLNSLGDLFYSVGDLAGAEGYHRRALAICQKSNSPERLCVATCLNSLGNDLYARWDVLGAEDCHRKALTIRESVSKDSLAVATSLNNLGVVLKDKGHLAEDNGNRPWAEARFREAETNFGRALAIREKALPPESEAVSTCRNNLATVLCVRGDLAGAERLYRRSVETQRQVAPGSLGMAGTLMGLGSVLDDLGHPTEAEACYLRALAIREKTAPGSLDVAMTLNNLAGLLKHRGELARAEEYGRRAWTIARKHGAQVSGDEARQAFGNSLAVYSTNLVDVQIRRGRVDAALRTLEEGRAQALQQLMAERAVTASKVKPDTWSAYQVSLSRYQQAISRSDQAAVAEAQARAARDVTRKQQTDQVVLAEKERLLHEALAAFAARGAEATQARMEMEACWASVKRESPVVFLAPVGIENARRLLPRGTVFLAFSASVKGVILFVAGRSGPVRAYESRLPVRELEAMVLDLRGAEASTPGRPAVLWGGREPLGVGRQSAGVKAARFLFRTLFPPEARRALAQAQRLVISPDGPLWQLPFAALITNDQGRPRYLGWEKPIVYTQSLTLLAQSLSSPPEPISGPVLAVGNPLYDNDRRAATLAVKAKGARSVKKSIRRRVQVGAVTKRQAMGEARVLTPDGSVPGPLPWAEEEAEQVAALYGTRAHVGVRPTEAWVRQWLREHGGRARVIHLATHGYLMPYRAMSSGVLLAVPEKTPEEGEVTANDGALQAWEIATELRLRADLVVLSACETGRGAEVPGEGLVGLTRALQIAGARSVVASQWQVADDSTQELMVAFHRQRKAGVGKDKALMLAMRQVAARSGWSHPHFWSPFVLVGDWR